MSDDATVQIQAQVTSEQFEALQELANRRGINANQVLQQAITTEKLIADNVTKGDELLIKKGDTVSRVIFRK